MKVSEGYHYNMNLNPLLGRYCKYSVQTKQAGMVETRKYVV